LDGDRVGSGALAPRPGRYVDLPACLQESFRWP
jgi:hypothetical protein